MGVVQHICNNYEEAIIAANLRKTLKTHRLYTELVNRTKAVRFGLRNFRNTFPNVYLGNFLHNKKNCIEFNGSFVNKQVCALRKTN